MTDMSRLEKYLAEDIKTFEGSAFPDIWTALNKLNELQNAEGVSGPVCEIGVHHGKFIIGLMLTKKSPRKSLAIDVFDLQEFNIDRSGNGNYEIFLDNVEQFCGSRDSVGVIKGDSLSLCHADIVDIVREYGKFSFFSIDGCHTAEHTAHDLSLAVELTCHGGVIMIDDYYHAGFPGVQEGVCRYFFTNIPRFVPFMYMRGKLFLTDLGHHKNYLSAITSHMKEGHPEFRVRRDPRFGYGTATITPKMPRRNRHNLDAPPARQLPATA